MKEYTALPLAVFAVVASTNALAFFDNNSKWDNPKCWYGPSNCNPYDQWDPRYWTEEFKQTWDNNSSHYGPYGYGLPYGGGYGAPGMRPYGPGFYGHPMRPYGGPAMARPMPGPNAASSPRPVALAPRPKNPAAR